MRLGKKNQLCIRAAASVACVLSIRWTVLNDDGVIEPSQETLVVPATRVITERMFILSDGVLQSVAVTLTDGAPRRGECFVTGSILKDSPFFAGAVCPLFQDYLVASRLLGYPGGIIRESVEEAGSPLLVAVPDPLVGVDFGYITPAGCRLKLKTATFTLTTGVALPARQARIFINTLGVITSVPFTATLQAAGLVYVYHFCAAPSFVGFLAPDDNSELNGGLILPAGSLISSGIINLAAADAITLIRLEFEHWLEI